MKKTLLLISLIGVVILFASLSLTSGAVCGNGVCEKGERESICPACVYQNPGCEQPCQIRAICKEDCEVNNPPIIKEDKCANVTCPASIVLTRCPSGCLYSKYYECINGQCIEKTSDLEAPCNPEANCGIFKSSDDIARCGNGICEQGEANSFYSIPCADSRGCPSPYITKEGTCPGDCGNKNIEIKFNEQLKNIEKNKTSIIKLSNGKNAEIKIMPSTASARAIERLSLKVCSVENNCTIVLKETGQGNDIKAVYEFKVKKNYRILALFKAKAENKIEIDSETGEVVVVKKPWWAFLAVSVE